MPELPSYRSMDPLDVMRELGMPPGSRWARQWTDGAIDPAVDVLPFVLQFAPNFPCPPEDCPYIDPPNNIQTDTIADWKGYRVEHFGRIGTIIPEGAPYWDEPVWTLERAANPPVLYIELWQQRAFYGDSPVYAQLDWRPGWPEPRASIQGLTVDTREIDVPPAFHGIRLLHRLPDVRAAQDFLTRLNQAIDATQKVMGGTRLPAIKTVQRKLGYGPSRLYQLVKDATGLTPKQYIEQRYTQNIGKNRKSEPSDFR